MTRALSHRGPNAQGLYQEPSVPLGLGHRRLSILDTSDLGQQPMTSASGRFVIVYNGEIYNYREMAKELEVTGFVPRSGTDTEVLLGGFDAYGVEQTIDRTIGMFAFAVWDRERRALTMGRDRLGKKPLYYGIVDGQLAFGSELRAIQAAFRGQLELDREAFELLARFGFIPEPRSVFRGINKLLPGRLITFSWSDGVVREGATKTYFDISELALSACRKRNPGLSDEEGLSELATILDDAVRLRLRSDVPLGAFLSGGIDSSLVVASMQAQSTSSVKTFSIGYHEREFDEAEGAARIAEHLGTRHTTFLVTPKDVRQLISKIPDIYDEPFADSSQLPTYLVSELARRHVTVVLTGDGGDEVFAGYNRHVWGQRVWSRIGNYSAKTRSAFASAFSQFAPSTWDTMARVAQPLLPGHLRVRQAGLKVQKFAQVAKSKTFEEMHLSLATHWRREDRVTVSEGTVSSFYELEQNQPKGLSPLDFALWFDTAQGLPGDMLVKVDRATMAVGLEARQPLLDHRLLELSWSLPERFRLRNGVGKWALRELLSQRVPRALFEKPKQGFGIPIGEWLRGPLKEWASDLLHPSSLRASGFFDPAVVEGAFQRHLSGAENNDQRLWIVLMAEQWLAQFRASALRA